ncbi:MAG: ATP synthase F1 subunit delta [Polyangiaceae bacterium]
MIAPHIARRYATALVEIGAEENSLDQIVEQVSLIAQTYEQNADLRKALENPLVHHDAKVAVLNDIAAGLGLSPTVKNTLLFMADRRRLSVLPGVAQRLREMNDLRRGIVRAEVVTAAPLSDEYYSRLQAQLEKMTGKRVVLDKRQDESIIAGVVTRIGDTIYDGSLKSRLQEIKNNLLDVDARTASAAT